MAVISSILAHPVMAGVGAIAGIAGVAVALVTLGASSEETRPGEGGNSVTIGGDVEDCSAVGSGAAVDCSQLVYPPAPKSIGNVAFVWGGAVTFLHNGPPDSLPSPPDYPLAEVRGHCDEWGEWLSSTESIYTISPAVTINAMSGQDDQVVIRSVEATVFKKEPLPGKGQYTIIECQYGAGGDPGSLIELDVSDNSVILADYELADPARMPMPPAVLELNGHDFEGATLLIDSSVGYLYSGRIRVSAVINGQPEVIDLGSQERPFKWVGGRLENTDVSTDVRWDWNPRTGEEWVQGLDPNSVYP